MYMRELDATCLKDNALYSRICPSIRTSRHAGAGSEQFRELMIKSDFHRQMILLMLSINITNVHEMKEMKETRKEYRYFR